MEEEGAFYDKIALMSMKKYTDDYEVVTTEDENGREKSTVRYRGDYFEVSLDEAGIPLFRRNCILLLAVIVILHLSGGFIGNRGMYQFYVALPYVLAFFPLLYMAAGILRLPKEKQAYRRDEIGLSFGRLKAASNVLIIFLGAGLVGEMIFILFVSTGNQNLLEYPYLAIEMLACAAVYWVIHLQKQIRIQPVPGKPDNSPDNHGG